METIKFKNQELAKAVRIAKQNNYRVFAFQKDVISQVFVVSETDEIGTIAADWDGIRYGTVHKPCRDFGTGFRLNKYIDIVPSVIDNIIKCTKTNKPNWAKKGMVLKYKNWNEYINFGANKVLHYYEI